ncbi:orotidine-5'-phosphate decarboxylase [Sphingomonas lutea]|uniref:Orotidine 5'-phosphate decarboxylase n=1 Tax=Sphingomonas lutea TaxID=1045317 RepID=A0A7G9SGS0_9SPHN|nr:orotidine-5'-phosphate decarboxylase [Sphingomonas lutea]QNN67045.1 orotidine-5'-phosphate decarboxylase [Sphingomonas lutea]
MNPIFVAIDTTDVHRAAALARDLTGAIGGVKLGLEFFCANGHEGVLRLAERELPVFLDLKLHDIPNTVGKAVRALAPLEPAILTVHAAGGRAMLAAAKEAAPAGTKVVAVTVLTSLDRSDLADCGIGGSPVEQVERLTALAKSAGVDGIVCSGAEVAAARAAWPDGFFVVPGIRPDGAETADQKRVVTPRQALDDGASILVIGRPITGATRPGEAASEIAASLRRAADQWDK